MRTRKVIKPKKKAILGALISTGTSLISGLVGNAKQKRLQEEEQQRQLALRQATAIQEDKIRLEDYKAEGEGEVEYYGKNGGKLSYADRTTIKGKRSTAKERLDGKYDGIDNVMSTKKGTSLNEDGVWMQQYAKKGGKLAIPTQYAKGGKLEPISSDMVEAKGKTHEQGGIDLGNVEIEDGETIKDGQKIYSDNLKAPNGQTYAKNAKRIARKKKKVEDAIVKGDALSQSTAERKLALLDKEENMLFDHQQARNGNQSVGKAEDGAKLPFADTKFGKGVAAVMPYMDNITNFILTAGSPKLKDPVLNKISPLKTKVNVNPQLRAINSAVDSSSKIVKDNSSSSQSARNKITSIKLQGSAQKANVLANKENQETTLHNQNVQHASRLAGMNANTLNIHADKQFARASDIQSRLSENVSNAVGDYIDKRNFDAEQKYNDERLDIARQTSVGGTALRADLRNPTEVQKLNTDSKYATEQWERYKGTPEEAEFLKLVPRFKRPLATPTLTPPF